MLLINWLCPSVCVHECKLSCLLSRLFNFVKVSMCVRGVCVCICPVCDVQCLCWFLFFFFCFFLQCLFLQLYFLITFNCIFDINTHCLNPLSSSVSLQVPTVSTWISSLRSWWRSAPEESPPLHPRPPPPPHPHPLPPLPPHSALQKDWRYGHTHLKIHTGYLYFPSLYLFSVHLSSLSSVCQSMCFFLSSPLLCTPSKGQSNQSGPIDPGCQLADPVYTSVSWTTSCETIVYPSHVHMSLSKALTHTLWHHNALHNM